MVKVNCYVNGIFQGVKEVVKADWLSVAKCLHGFGFEIADGVFEYTGESNDITRLVVGK